MDRQGHLAVGTLPDAPAAAALQETGVAAAIQEQDGLAARYQVAVDPIDEPGAEYGVFFFPHINNLHLRHGGAGGALRQREVIGDAVVTLETGGGAAID